MTNKCREEFEKWAAKEDYNLKLEPSGEYFQLVTHHSYQAFQAAYQLQEAKLNAPEIIETGAIVMQKAFPLVQTGTDTNGDWQVKPFEIELFKMVMQKAISAIQNKLRGG